MNAAKSLLLLIVLVDAVMLGGLAYGIQQNESGFCISVSGLSHGHVALQFQVMSATDAASFFKGTKTSLVIFANESIGMKPISCGLFPNPHAWRIALPKNPVSLWTGSNTGNATYGVQPFTIDYLKIPWYLCDYGPSSTNPNVSICDPFVEVYHP